MLIFGFGILILNIIAKWSVIRYLILSTFSICVEYIEVKLNLMYCLLCVWACLCVDVVSVSL